MIFLQLSFPKRKREFSNDRSRERHAGWISLSHILPIGEKIYQETLRRLLN